MTRSEAPETLEGWYIQHDMYTVNWPQMAQPGVVGARTRD